jgi:hypothetical protein
MPPSSPERFMKALIRTCVLALSLLPTLISAQEPHPFAGAWKGVLGTAGAQSEVRIELRIEGDVVTGPILGPAGEMFMQPGKVTARGVSFTSGPLNPQDRDVPLVWTGQATDENTLTFVVTAEDLEGPTFELTVTRDTARR